MGSNKDGDTSQKRVPHLVRAVQLWFLLLSNSGVLLSSQKSRNSATATSKRHFSQKKLTFDPEMGQMHWKAENLNPVQTIREGSG